MEAVTLSGKPSENGLPPTYLHSLRIHLNRKGRENVNERDKRLLKYIRLLQETRRKPGFFRFP